MLSVSISNTHKSTMGEGGWEGSLAHGHLFSAKELPQRHRDKPKICSGGAAVNWNASVLLVLLCSSAFPIPPNCLQWHFAILFSSLWLVFWIVWGDYLNFVFGMGCFCSSVRFIWLFWLVRHCCFLPSYLYSVCFKRNTLGLCNRSFLSSF